MTEVTLPPELKGSEVQKLSVGPGDVIILRVHTELSQQQQAHADAYMRHLFRGTGARWGVLGPNAELQVVHPDEHEGA